MAITTYEVPLDWEFDTNYVNSAQGIHYLAWQIGIDLKGNKAIWLFAAVRPSPIDINTLLPPVGTTANILSDDVGKSGYTRSISPNEDISAVAESFTEEVVKITQAVIDGYR